MKTHWKKFKRISRVGMFFCPRDFGVEYVGPAWAGKIAYPTKEFYGTKLCCLHSR